MALDAARQLYSAVIQHAFTLSLKCPVNATTTGGTSDNSATCPQDGDTIETTISMTPQAGNGTPRMPAEVRVEVEVQAAISCECTQPTVRIIANMDLDSLLPSARFSVNILAFDADNLAVRFTRANISVMFGTQPIYVQWNRGSNEYVADVAAEAAEALAQPGRYDLVVSASDAWNEAAGQTTSCELLRRTMRVLPVEEGLSTNAVMAGAGAAAVVVVGGSVFLVHKRHAHLQAIMVMLFTEVSPPFDEPHAGMHLVKLHDVCA